MESLLTTTLYHLRTQSLDKLRVDNRRILWYYVHMTVRIGDLIRYADRHGVHYGLVMKIVEPDIDDDRQIYCSWLNEDPGRWSWVEQEDAEVISASR